MSSFLVVFQGMEQQEGCLAHEKSLLEDRLSSMQAAVATAALRCTTNSEIVPISLSYQCSSKPNPLNESAQEDISEIQV
jgi:hypothetical protein